MHPKWAALAAASSKWSAATARPAETALGMIWLRAEHAEVGYISHPAVVDSSMHLSVFSSGADSQTRVPGASRYPAAPLIMALVLSIWSWMLLLFRTSSRCAFWEGGWVGIILTGR